MGKLIIRRLFFRSETAIQGVAAEEGGGHRAAWTTCKGDAMRNEECGGGILDEIM